jgi:hypothetical protein
MCSGVSPSLWRTGVFRFAFIGRWQPKQEVIQALWQLKQVTLLLP